MPYGVAVEKAFTREQNAEKYADERKRKLEKEGYIYEEDVRVWIEKIIVEE